MPDADSGAVYEMHNKMIASALAGRRYSDGDFVNSDSCMHSIEQRECHSAETSTEHAPCPHCEIDAHYSKKIDKIQNRSSSIFSLVQKLKKYQSKSSGGLELNIVQPGTTSGPVPGTTFIPNEHPKRNSRGFLPLLPILSRSEEANARGKTKLTPPHICGGKPSHPLKAHSHSSLCDHRCKQAGRPIRGDEISDGDLDSERPGPSGISTIGDDPLSSGYDSSKLNYLEPVHCPHASDQECARAMHNLPEYVNTTADVLPEMRNFKGASGKKKYGNKSNRHLVNTKRSPFFSSSSSDLDSSESSGPQDGVYPLDPNSVIIKCDHPGASPCVIYRSGAYEDSPVVQSHQHKDRNLSCESTESHTSSKAPSACGKEPDKSDKKNGHDAKASKGYCNVNGSSTVNGHSETNGSKMDLVGTETLSKGSETSINESKDCVKRESPRIACVDKESSPKMASVDKGNNHPAEYITEHKNLANSSAEVEVISHSSVV